MHGREEKMLLIPSTDKFLLLLFWFCVFWGLVGFVFRHGSGLILYSPFNLISEIVKL